VDRIWRRMLKISWVDKVSNAEVLQKVQENKSILDIVQYCKFRWIGHILRHDSLLRDIIEGRMKGKVTRGRKRLQMLSDVITKSYEDLKREVEDRSWWKEKGVINLPSKAENQKDQSPVHCLVSDITDTQTACLPYLTLKFR